MRRFFCLEFPRTPQSEITYLLLTPVPYALLIPQTFPLSPVPHALLTLQSSQICGLTHGPTHFLAEQKVLVQTIRRATRGGEYF